MCGEPIVEAIAAGFDGLELELSLLVWYVHLVRTQARWQISQGQTQSVLGGLGVGDDEIILPCFGIVQQESAHFIEFGVGARGRGYFSFRREIEIVSTWPTS